MPPSRTGSLLIALISTLTLPAAGFCADGREIRFEHLTVEQGLSSNGVFAIFQDSRGFMWFGTDDGLDKYDGYSFTVYKHDPLDSNSISTNNIPYIYEDRSGTIWLLGPWGNSYCGFDRATGKFTRRYDLGYWAPPDLQSNFHEDSSGAIWFAASNKGLLKFDRTRGTFVQYTLSSDTVYGLCADPDEAARFLWVGTTRGLDRFDRANGTFTHYEHASRNRINVMHGDKFGMLWMGTDEGLYKFDRAARSF